jgi:hypothetical protein
MARIWTTHPLSCHISLYWSMLLGLRYSVFYTLFNNPLSTLLDFKGTLPALHRLGSVASANWHGKLNYTVEGIRPRRDKGSPNPVPVVVMLAGGSPFPNRPPVRGLIPPSPQQIRARPE